MAKCGTHYEFFVFYKHLAEEERYQKYLQRLKDAKSVYVLTRSGGRWHVRFPRYYGSYSGRPGHITTECYTSFMRDQSPFNNQNKKRKRFTLTDWLQMVKDLQKVWLDAPLHIRIGHGEGGNYVTEQILDEDELIIHLKYMDQAC
jgi:hypothetical protein